jgi:hypothetical protein
MEIWGRRNHVCRLLLNRQVFRGNVGESWQGRQPKLRASLQAFSGYHDANLTPELLLCSLEAEVEFGNK